MFVKPARGIVIMPDIGLGHRMPEAGVDVPENAYYLRLLRYGDIVRADAEVSLPAVLPMPIASAALVVSAPPEVVPVRVPVEGSV